MDFNSVSAILLYEEGEVTGFHLDVTLFDRCRREVKTWPAAGCAQLDFTGRFPSFC